MHLLSFHRRIVSAGLLLMVIDWIFENCYNYKSGSGEWQYKTTYEPLSTNGSADGHTRYVDYWWNQTTGTEQKSRQVTYYRYRDYK